jgi:hypothetical protein
VEPSQQVMDGESAKLQCRNKATGQVDKVFTEEDRAAKKAVSTSEEARRGGRRKKGGVEGKGGGGRFRLLPPPMVAMGFFWVLEREEKFLRRYLRREIFTNIIADKVCTAL